MKKKLYDSNKDIKALQGDALESLIEGPWQFPPHIPPTGLLDFLEWKLILTFEILIFTKQKKDGYNHWIDENFKVIMPSKTKNFFEYQ